MFNVVFHCDFALDENTLWFGDLLSRGFFFNGSRSERLPQFLGLYELKWMRYLCAPHTIHLKGARLLYWKEQQVDVCGFKRKFTDYRNVTSAQTSYTATMSRGLFVYANVVSWLVVFVIRVCHSMCCCCTARGKKNERNREDLCLELDGVTLYLIRDMFEYSRVVFKFLRCIGLFSVQT